MGLVLVMLVVTLPLHGLLMLASLRNRQMNQYILNDALAALRLVRHSRGH